MDGKWIKTEIKNGCEGVYFRNDSKEGYDVEEIIYYTKDENGDYSVPRILIIIGNYQNVYNQMSNVKKIYTIRGVGEEGNLEEEMEPILMEKLKILSDDNVADFSIKYFLKILESA